MINDLIKYLENKKIIILGFGKEGESTYKLIRKYIKNQKLYIADKRKDFQKNYDFFEKDDNVKFISGDRYLEGLEEYDIIMKSPGISFVGIDTTLYSYKIKSQLELLLEFFNNFTIGITGTKGKSTTSSLINKILQDQGKNSILLGNIGVPVFDYIDVLKEDMILVLEMSSHQLEYMELSPNIAILLNIYEEHLDHYESFEKYAMAKCNIFRYQKNDDYLLYNIDDKTLERLVKDTNSVTYKVSLEGKPKSDIYINNENVYFKNKSIYDTNLPRNLLGEYNLNNIMFALRSFRNIKTRFE